MSESLFASETSLSDLQRRVLAALSVVGPSGMEEGEIREAIGRSWSLYPTLRSLLQRRLIERVWPFSYGLARPKPVLTVIKGGRE